jgi:hypothetical protein
MKKIMLVVGLCLGVANHVSAQNTSTTVVTSPAVPAVVTVLTQAQIDTLVAQCAVSSAECRLAASRLLMAANRAGFSAIQFNELAVSITGALVRAAVVNPNLRINLSSAILDISASTSSEFALLSPSLRGSLEDVSFLVRLGRASQVDLTAVASVIRTVPIPPVPLPSGGQNGSPS